MLQIDSTRTDGQNKSGSFPSLYPQQQLAVPTMTMPKTPVAESASVQLPTPVEIPTATLPAPTTNPYASFLPNTGFRITTSYGSPSASSNPALKGRAHNAIDIGTPMNTPFYSPGYGTVIQNEPQNGTYSIRFSNGNTMVLAHTKERYFNIGDTVRPGDLLGLSGNTGDSTGPHTHLGIIDKKGNRLNPTNFYYGKENPFGQGDVTDNVALDKTKDLTKYVLVPANSYAATGNPLAIGGNSVSGFWSPNPLNPSTISTISTVGVPNTTSIGPNGETDKVPMITPVPTTTLPVTPVVTSGTNPQVTQPGSVTLTAEELKRKSLYDQYLAQQEILKTPFRENVLKGYYDNISAITPAGMEFNPSANPLDRALVDSGILGENDGKNVDITTLRALRLQMDTVLKNEANLSDQAASNANTEINVADKAALAMIGGNPGDIGQSSAGRNAMFSYTKAANKNIADFNTKIDAAKLQTRSDFATKAIAAQATDKQNAFNLMLSKAQALSSVKMSDKEATQQAKANEAILNSVVDGLIKTDKNDALAQLNSLTVSMGPVIASYKTTIDDIEAKSKAITNDKERADYWGTANVVTGNMTPNEWVINLRNQMTNYYKAIKYWNDIINGAID